ncbi:outer membrane immunogenic protein [Hyphomicrobium sp. 1Nfss2.1]|uniref:outer membrane beta-barrel protein n=1 Tax=Hyphomicrobium sp. 1Nfss2.1 TaxID=3413936 RepID=UPI003C7B332A
MRRQAASLQGLAFLIAASMVEPCSADEIALHYDWSGAYVGASLGGALTLTDIDNPFGASLYGDTVRSPGPFAGGQIGYNWQFGRALLGLEADASWADLFGTETCFAYSGYYISANCRANIDALGTLSARAGWTVGNDGATLLYGKAGVAWMHSDVDATTNDNAGFATSASDRTHWGWMLGAGIERALGGRWSMKAEYDYLSFADAGFSTPEGSLQPTPSPTPANLISVPSTATDASTQMHLFKVGLNYRLYEPHATTAADDWAPVGAPQPVTGTALEIGARYVYGWGRFQKDLGIQGEGLSSLASRLTYSDMTTNGAELFARLDLHGGLMVKGFVGKGNGNGGHLNDEDWGLPFADFVPYSNTWSAVDDRIRYGVIDVGYDVWRTQQFRFSPFVGYSVFHQYMLGLGCHQIANPHSDCSTPIPVTTEVISEDDTWRALRLGVSADIEIIPGITLSADAAYLGYVHFSGVDDHVLRSLLSPETANGTGAQLELMLKYALTDQLSVGVGGRYWTMWTPDGTVNFGGEAIVPMRYSVEQTALLVQGSYTFSVPTD